MEMGAAAGAAAAGLPPVPPLRRRRRLSATRVLLAAALAGGLAVGGATLVDDAISALEPRGDDPWYAPYVDTTLTPRFHFEDPTDNPSADVVLGFIVAGERGGCEPTWGTYYDLDEAATQLDLDRRIARLRQRDGDVIVSFGGVLNNELAVRCDDVEELVGAYGSVIDRYQLTTIDFDVEGAALQDEGASRRRAEATKRLQDAARAEGRPLAVWLTLPVAPQGMTAEAVAVVDAMLAADVDLAGVNVMTMNYGGSRAAGTGMLGATTQALESTWQQLGAAYRRAGSPLADADVWRKVGATPMIGQNDAPGERFTLEDARALVDFARRQGLGRVSMWSVNRDGPCGAQWDRQVASNTCSGLDQEPLAFTSIFSELSGRAGEAADRPAPAAAPAPVVDDPATSPYPIWRAQRIYEAGRKVVWHGNVYEAKWWTQGDLPDEPVVNVWDTPWRYIGPVLASDVPRATTSTSASTALAWDPQAVYQQGDRVSSGGLTFEAKWWTRGEQPDDDVDRPWDTPWELVEG